VLGSQLTIGQKGNHQMQRLNVLISGAGIAGMTLAYWLARNGLRVTVVERGSGQRSSGSPVDVRGQAREIAEQMSIGPRLRQAATDVAGMRFVDSHGRVAARVDRGALQGASGSRDVEIARGDLAAILQEASRDNGELLFGDAIQAIAQDSRGVDVEFQHAPPRRFDLVVGADGLHSGVRRLVFGPERQFVHHAGLYVATFPVNGWFDGLGRDITMFNAPGRSATIHPARTRPLAAFIFWRVALADFDQGDTEQHRRIVQHMYQGDGWHVPALLEQMRTTGDLYFDSVSRVQIPRWSCGRVVLVGDAASCVSLLGDGSSLAMIGAHALAHAIAQHRGAHALAFQQFEADHRRLVEPRQRWMALAATLLVPKTETGIMLRNAALRLAPLVTFGRRLRGYRLDRPDARAVAVGPASE
jgi:2-polyprenyl-6-methoxyphenol hydroxylase-like FAD-dependent oxidoreductase